MVRFSAPEEKAVKAVLIGKNHKLASFFSYIFVFMLLFTVTYGILTSFANGFYTIQMAFTDKVLAGLVCFTIFFLSLTIFYFNKPISKKTLDDHGRYDVILDGENIKVLFPEEPEVIVSIKDVDEVVEYDIFYLIHIYGHKDEIVCSKNAFTEGDAKTFEQFFVDNGKRLKKSGNKRIYSSILNHVTKDIRPGFAAFVYSAIACAISYPLFWLLAKVLILYVPTVLSSLMLTLWDVQLVLQLLLGVLFVPVGLLITLVCLVASVTVLAFPVFLIFVSFKDAIAQLETKNKAVGYCALVFVVLATLFCVFIILRVLGVL